MRILERKLLEAKQKNEAVLIADGDHSRSKREYIKNAEKGMLVAFRLNFMSKKNVKLTKLISGKILDNRTEDEMMVIETKNKLRYAVPYSHIMWVKTSYTWPRGIYEEMKLGSVAVDDDGSEFVVIGELSPKQQAEYDIIED